MKKRFDKFVAEAIAGAIALAGLLAPAFIATLTINILGL